MIRIARSRTSALRILTAVIAIVMSVMMLIPGFTYQAYAAEDDAGITYTITVYAGDSGKFSDGSSVKKFAGMKYGDTLYINVNSGDTKVVVNSDVADKYYARGFKFAGHDNDEISQLQLVSYNHRVTGDESFTVAYGMKGGMVKYTINYVDENGNELLPSEEYYGMAGDYPVVSYQYVEGYAPNAYNLGRTLTDDPGNNVFTFTYSPSNLTQDQQAAQAGQPGAGAGAAGAAGAGAAGANAADGTTIGDNATPLADVPNVVDLDDGDVPLADPDDNTGLSELSTQKLIAMIAGGACAIALIAAIVALLVRRRNSDDEDEDDEELEGAIEEGLNKIEDSKHQDN